MTIQHGYPRTGGTDTHWQWLQAGCCDLAEDLADLAPDFLFLFGNVGNHVVEDVQTEHSAAAASARDSLQRRHHHGVDPEGVDEGGQGDDQPYGRAVGIRCDKTLPA